MEQLVLGVQEPKVSFFNRGNLNKAGKAVLAVRPEREVTISDVYQYVTSETAKMATDELRTITDKDSARAYKNLHFEFVTFGGVFSYRKATDLLSASGFQVLDIDGLPSTEKRDNLRQRMVKDDRLHTVLSFISPSGNGLKNIVQIDESMNLSYSDYFTWMMDYVAFEYGIEVDKSGRDICRACFLPYDPTCYINEKFLNKNYNV